MDVSDSAVDDLLLEPSEEVSEHIQSSPAKEMKEMSESYSFGDLTAALNSTYPDATFQHSKAEAETTHDHYNLVCRDGTVKKLHRRGGYQADRLRKSSDQITYLKRIYAETGGKLDRKQRKLVEKVTGLSWI